MKEMKANKILLCLVGFLCGRAVVYGINPFVVPVLIGTLYMKLNAFGLVCSMILGMLSLFLKAPVRENYILANSSYGWGNISPSIVYVLRYVLVLVVVIIAVNIAGSLNRRYYRNKGHIAYGRSLLLKGLGPELPFVAITVLVLSIIFNYKLYEGGMIYAFSVCEMLVSICIIPAVTTGLRVIIRHEEEREKYNEELLGVLIVAAICLWGMPVMVWDVIPWLMICGMYVSWYTIYRYNAGYGIAVTGVCGMIMAIQTGTPELVGSMFIIAIIAMAGKVVSDRRKPGIFAGILLGSVVAGITYFDYFLTLEAVKTVGASALAFMLTPRQWMFVKDDTVYGRYNMETATEMNRITAEKIRELSGAFKRIEYTLAGCGTAAVKVNLGEIGDMIGRFSDNLENTESIPVYKENLLRDKLLEQGVILNNITSVKNEMNRRRYYITARTKGRKIMLSKDMAEIMSEVFRQSVRISEDTPAIISENNRVITFEENAGYRCYYNVRRIKKYGSNVSGDNFSVKEHEDGRLVMMISDGMGSGSLASCESTLLIDTMEEMMEAGFDPSYGIAFSNECISEKNNGCSFTTFDMGVIDLYDGNLKVYKQGAAATYVAHETGEGRSIEVIKGTTLPIGVLPEAECDVIETKLEDNDIIVMASDGIMDETCIEDVLNKTDSDNCKEILEDIVTSLLCLSQGKLRDDVTLIVARMEKNL